MKVSTTIEAWDEANKIFPYDYLKDEEASQNNGYPVYRATAEGHSDNWISDLGDRLEVNTEDGKSVNIWISDEQAIAMTKDFEAFVSDLAVFADKYVMEIKNYLASKAFDIYKDKTIVMMLHEHAIRVQKKQHLLKRDMLSMLRHPDLHFEISEPLAMDSPEPYREVLDDLLIREWWHEQQKEAE